ncbi:MAG: YkgJ family cysteine cluster protein [Blastocatellia bacterium]|nr:YkgJ family cysteine cluster protein [Blastocatellia bacterium]
MKVLYNCDVCPGYCCTYTEIGISKHDIGRIAKRFKIDVDVAIERYCKTDGKRLLLKHKRDKIYKTACRFLDTKSRKCKIYEDRPKVCRAYPEEKRCGYYDFLMWERERQNDPECIP